MIAAELFFELLLVGLGLFFLSVFLLLGLHGRAGRASTGAGFGADGLVRDGDLGRKRTVCGACGSKTAVAAPDARKTEEDFS